MTRPQWKHGARRWLPLSLAAWLAALSGAAVAMEEEPAATGVLKGVKMISHPDWFKDSFLDLADDVAAAAREDRHLVLIMEMNGCPYCYKLVQDNFANSPYQDFIRTHFDVIALNTKGDREVAATPELTVTEKELAEIYQVRFTPTVIFLDQDNNPVARVSGYRNPDDFKRVLDYVRTKAYRDLTLSAYLERQPGLTDYQLREHPQFQAIEDLSRVADRPLAVLFEEHGCTACTALHEGHLADPDVRAALEAFVAVRLDARAETPLVDPLGQATTPREWAETLGVQYRPTLVLFDQGREIARIESMLYRYHFVGFLEYVGQGHYRDYPERPFDYIDAKTARLLAAGQDVVIADD